VLSRIVNFRSSPALIMYPFCGVPRIETCFGFPISERSVFGIEKRAWKYRPFRPLCTRRTPTKRSRSFISAGSRPLLMASVANTYFSFDGKNNLSRHAGQCPSQISTSVNFPGSAPRSYNVCCSLLSLSDSKAKFDLSRASALPDGALRVRLAIRHPGSIHRTHDYSWSGVPKTCHFSPCAAPFESGPQLPV
jgi:hypothetical protein